MVKRIIIAFFFVALVASNAVTLKLYLEKSYPDNTGVEEAAGDELSRVKFFIKDWYDELSALYGEPEIFRNELRFLVGKYPLTVAADRVRAVYPRGERYFQLEYVSYLEFYKDNGHLVCKLYYLDTGEYLFRLT